MGDSVRTAPPRAYEISMTLARHQFVAMLVVAAFGTALQWPGGAQAAGITTCESAPGTAAVDQYCEQVPGVDGDRGSTGGSNASSGGSGAPDQAARAALHSRVRAATIRRLRKAGPAGRELLRSIRVAPGTIPAHRATTTRSSPPAPAPAGDPLNAVRASVSSGAAAGQVFVFVLLGMGLVLVGAAWFRWRRAHA